MFKEKEIVALEHDFTDYLEDREQVFLQSDEIALYNERCYPKLKKLDEGRLLLTDRGLLFIKQSDCKSIRYHFENIRGRSTEKNFIFQIVATDDTGKFIIGRFEMPHESCLKWELYYDYIRKKSGFENDED